MSPDPPTHRRDPARPTASSPEAGAVANLLEPQRPPPGEPRYRELFRNPSLSAGVYRLPAGSVDPQSPHTEDELYYVVDGDGVLRIADADLPARPGALLYVPANTPHRFHSVGRALVLLVFFAPPEGSRGPPQ